jgi:hypothetical protein
MTTSELVWSVLTYGFYAALAWLFVGWPIAAGIGRDKLRHRLETALGPEFDPDKLFVRWSGGIAVAREAPEFVFANGKSMHQFRGEDILTVSFGPGTSSQFGGQLLDVTLRSKTVPRIRLETMSPSARLSNVAGLLSGILAEEEKKRAEAKEKEGGLLVPNKHQDSGFEHSIEVLANAIVRLAAALEAKITSDKQT